MAAVVVSTLSRVKKDREQFERYFLRTITVLALLGMGVGADFALVGKDLISFSSGTWLGGGWSHIRFIRPWNRRNAAL